MSSVKGDGNARNVKMILWFSMEKIFLLSIILYLYCVQVIVWIYRIKNDASYECLQRKIFKKPLISGF